MKISRLKYCIYCVLSIALLGNTPLLAQVQISEEEVNTQKVFIDASKEKILGNYENAIYLFKEVLKRDKDNDVAAYELARIYEAREELDKAVQSIKMALKLAPDNEWYQLFLADAYENSGQPRDAAKIFRKLLKQFPENPFYYERLAFSLVRAKEIEKAIDTYNQMEKKFGISEDISRRKHRLYLGVGNQKKAANELERLIQSAPSNIDYYHMLAGYYQQVGNEGSAKGVYQRILAIDSTDVRASIALAGSKKTEGDDASYLSSLRAVFEKSDVPIDLKMKEFIPYIQKVVNEPDPELNKTALELAAILERVHPKEAKAYSAHADLLYHSGDLATALEKYQTALTLNKSIFTIWEQMMYIHTEMNNFEALLPLTEDAIDRFPNKAKAYYFNGLAKGQLKNHREAVNSFKQGLLMSRRNPPLQLDIYNHLATEYYQLGQYEKSDEAFERALSLNPKDHRVLNRYSYYLALRGAALDKAKEMSSVANELAPNQPTYQDTYGWVLYQMKEYKAAKEWIAKALDNGGDVFPDILEHYGDVLYQLEDTASAITYWKQALEKGSDSELLEKKVAEGKLNPQ